MFASDEDFEGWSDVIDLILTKTSTSFSIKNWLVEDSVDSFSDDDLLKFSASFIPSIRRRTLALGSLRKLRTGKDSTLSS